MDALTTPVPDYLASQGNTFSSFFRQLLADGQSLFQAEQTIADPTVNEQLRQQNNRTHPARTAVADAAAEIE